MSRNPDLKSHRGQAFSAHGRGFDRLQVPRKGISMPDAITRSRAVHDAAPNGSTSVPTRLAPLPADVGLAVQTLARLRPEGKGPRFVRVSRLMFYRAADVRHWLEKHTYRNTTYVGQLQADIGSRTLPDTSCRSSTSETGGRS
jgi:hypothetical protein